MVYRTAHFSMTLKDPIPRFQGQAILWHWISPKWLEILQNTDVIIYNTIINFCRDVFVGGSHLVLPHFAFPWVRPWDNRSKCHTVGKRIQCLWNASLYIPSIFNRFWDIASYWSKIATFSYTNRPSFTFTDGQTYSLAVDARKNKTETRWAVPSPWRQSDNVHTLRLCRINIRIYSQLYYAQYNRNLKNPNLRYLNHYHISLIQRTVQWN